MAILEVKNLKKSFGSLEVLKGIDFDLEKGEVMAVIGASGNGKTTLLRCINFLETPDEGTIKVNGETIFDSSEKGELSESEKRNRRLHFGLVFQNFNLFPQYTALENVCLAAKLNSPEPKDQIEAEGLELLRKVGLEDKKDYYPHQLSGGQQQRVAIARALLLKPDILCFDEPTSALDPELTGEVLKVIKTLADANMTMIVVTHEMKFARDVASKVIFMDNGEILEEGTPEQIFDRSTNERIRSFIGKISEQS